jgi:hypothetical protein
MVTVSTCPETNSVVPVMSVSWFLKITNLVKIPMNVMQTCAPTETAETPLDHSHVHVMKASFSVEMFVKMLMNVFQVHALVAIASTHLVVIDATVMTVRLSEPAETRATIKRRELVGCELRMGNALETLALLS